MRQFGIPEVDVAHNYPSAVGINPAEHAEHEIKNPEETLYAQEVHELTYEQARHYPVTGLSMYPALQVEHNV